MMFVFFCLTACASFDAYSQVITAKDIEHSRDFANTFLLYLVLFVCFCFMLAAALLRYNHALKSEVTAAKELAKIRLLLSEHMREAEAHRQTITNHLIK